MFVVMVHVWNIIVVVMVLDRKEVVVFMLLKGKSLL